MNVRGLPAAPAPLLLLALAGCGQQADPAVRGVELGDGWQVRGSTDTVWVSATVPGTVHTDLLAAGRIPDPFTGDREAELAWIEDEAWTYRLDFETDPDLLEEERLEMVFEGLDTWASVTLNGTGILEADNMFRTWRVDVRGTLRAGANRLEVRFSPPAAKGAERAAAHPWPIPHQEPDARGTRAFSRKAAYHFGWDWGPRFVTSGIWRPVRLEAWSSVRITDARVSSLQLRGDTALVRFVVDMDAAGEGDDASVRVGVRSPDGSFRAVMEDVALPAAGGSVAWETTLVVPGAELWWPRGAGRGSPRLYDVEVDAVQGRRWDRRAVRVGLRTVELVTERDSIGESFLFRVNGEPLFVRGANVVPPDHFTPRADSSAYARLVTDAAAANMNMLRVWGGGVYLPDVFYDLADQAGILIWQDFMFANALVPRDSSFVASVAAEAEDQVRRLRRHPSLALWCGNNEIAEGWASWGWQADYAPDVLPQVEAAYRRVFEDALAGVVARLDGGRTYIPSSPRHGWGRAESLTEGDSHYWGVWWGLEPFRVYAEKVPRFASEFGFQALPDMATVAAFGSVGKGTGGTAAESAPRSLSDPVMRAHQKHPAGYETIRAYLEREWPVPPDDSLDAWSYLTQLAQADGVGLALEAHRRSWPRTGGTLYWQLNDTWPVVSWSGIDSFGRWKALHHRAREVFAPVAVLADAWSDTVAVWVAADAPVRGRLEVRALSFDGATLATRAVDTSADGRAAVLVWRELVDRLLPMGTDPRSVVVEASFTTGDGATHRDLQFLVPPVALDLPDPGVRVVEASPEGDGWRVSLTADRLAFGVRVSVDGVGARVSDNFFHLLPGDTVTVRVTPEEPMPDLPARLQLRALRPD
ncbi:MAG: beta-mannosidase [Longimicrobiales bacterium]